ncbi:MAG: pyruvate/2-oxoglutarate dehydrogenase complex dihydrolipoamideacyltransferase (E2) component [Osedax symbiont Rs1]|nr:MAG: pyruvate/2-oxoglutarate dehydrogenase complex dihydrolipoamideacyltransferase (E2) component [Osedax symbiont Rs1]
MTIFKLSDLGEGLVEAEIVEWFIKAGDSVVTDQVIVAMETAKAIVEIPSPHTGTIHQLFGQQGDIIHTGDPLLAFKLSAAATTSPIGSTESTSVVGEIPSNQQALTEPAQASSGRHHIGVKATPAVRALARRYDIELSVVTPSGPDGTIKTSDIERVVKIYADVGKLQPLTGVRRAMAKSMAQAHAEVVAVTVIDDADINHWPTGTDITVRLIGAIVCACKQEPSLNAWYDSHSIGRRLLDKVHLGLAVETKDGLFVPVIKNVGQYQQEQLRAKIVAIKDLLLQRKISAEQLRGNSITLSNFGSIGGKYANPIVVPPTVAIIGAGRRYTKLILKHGVVEEHQILPLSLSFDHRAATGAEAANFMRALIADLQSSKD